jgi:hypothetical protein
MQTKIHKFLYYGGFQYCVFFSQNSLTSNNNETINQIAQEQQKKERARKLLSIDPLSLFEYVCMYEGKGQY